MKVVKGDLIKMALEGQFDVIVHGCNCFCTMGSGIARQIRETFPQAYGVDKRSTPGDINKLGEYSWALKRIDENSILTIVNAYTQYKYGGGEQHTDYDAIRRCFNKIKKEFYDCRIGYPKIGAGLGGGDWNIISKIIDEELAGCDHTLVEYQP